jgi:ATP-dependent Clp protease ATP-binding subunit ClpC
METGAHGKSGGAKDFLKEFLTNGNIYTLSTLTLQEYQNKVQTNPPLARRFNPVFMVAPTDAETAEILIGLKAAYTKHHGLTINKDMLHYVAEMAGRYIHQVNQPDKSIDLLDEACALAVRNGDKSLMKKHIIKATSHASNIKEDFLSSSDNARYAKLPKVLNNDVLEQEPAVTAVSSAVQRSKAGLNDPNKPVGNFIFLGNTGVGKTELAKSLSLNIFGSLDNLIRFDMSEYQEKHQAARLIGAPPGYVGYEEGGQLINKVRAKPYSVILMDEIEKAHPDIFQTLLGPFDNGIITDGRGVSANMSHTINIMTSNLGAAAVWAEGERLKLDPLKHTQQWNEMAFPIYQKAIKFFTPEFLNRIDAVVIFNSLSKNAVGTLVDREVEKTRSRLKGGAFKLDFELSPVFRDYAIEKGFDVRMGARPLKRAWEQIVVSPLSSWLLSQGERKLKKADKVMISQNGVPGVPVFELIKV